MVRLSGSVDVVSDGTGAPGVAGAMGLSASPRCHQYPAMDSSSVALALSMGSGEYRATSWKRPAASKKRPWRSAARASP